MARGRKPDNNNKPNIKIDNFTCLSCGKTKAVREFYVSYNPLHQVGRLPYCKDCLKSMCLDANGVVSVDKVKSMLKLIDRPFLYDIFKISCEDANDSIGTYFKNLAMPQYRTYGWSNSSLEPTFDGESYSEDYDDIFEVTPDMIRKWGNKYESYEYYELEKFYNDMMMSNSIETAQDIAYLKKLSIISLKLDNALTSGNSSEAKQLGDLFSKYMADSKFRAIDKTEADKSGGVRRFCDIFAEVEKDEFIPPWEKYRKINGAKQDIVDKTIMFILNYMLKFNKSEKLSTPPIDTPLLETEEIDENAKSLIELSDLEEIDEDSYE